MRHVKVMADYQCFPLWGVLPGELGDIDPSTLPISTELVEKLLAWSDKFDSTLNMDDPRESGFKTREEAEKFRFEGYQLATQLKDELGDSISVIYHVCGVY